MLRTSLNTNVGEQLPGSLEAIRKAVEKFYKKDISTSEMFQLMKDGKLLAKDILPLLGEEFSKMAKTGDALKFALSSLSTVQQRMNTSFREWINNVYKGGLAEGLSDLYKLLDNIFWAMSQGESASGGFLKGFLGAARDSIAAVNDGLNDLVLFVRYRLGVKGADAEFLGKVAYWVAIAGAMNVVAGLMKTIFGGSMLSMIMKVSTAMGGLVALPFAIVAALNELYEQLGWIQDPKAMAQQTDVITKMRNQAVTSGMPMFAQPFFQQQIVQAQNQAQSGQITLKLETTSDVDKLVQGHIETNNQRMIQAVLPTGWVGTSK